MKFALPLLGVSLFPALLCAQPVMNIGDAPQLDDIFPYVTGTYAPISVSGPDALWDLSGIGTSEVSHLPCEAPDATAFGTLYPTATLALDAGSVISFMRADTTGLYIVGVYKQIGTLDIQIHYTNESLMLPYPCSYNTAYTDTFAYNYTYPGGTVNGGGHSAYAADGFGTLVLPFDTVYNVLKITGVDTVTEGIPGTTYVTTSQQVYFYKPGIHYYLLSATELTQTVNGGSPQTGSGLTYMAEEAFSAISENSADAIGIDAWPMPAHDVLNIGYGLTGGRRVDIALFDAAGRRMHTQRTTTTASGIQRAAIDVTGLPAGIYLLQVTDDHGQRGTRRVVVQ